MFAGAKKWLGDKKEKAKHFVKKGLASHETVDMTVAIGTVVSKPYQALTWTFFLEQIYNKLSDPRPTEDAPAFSSEELNLIQICAVLSSEVYSPPAKRTLPRDAGEIVFEPKLVHSKAVPFMVLNSDALDCIFIACRGSYCFNDFVIDLNASAVEIFGGLMHRGVVKAALGVYTIVKDLVIELHQRYHRKICVTGHSLGGAVAASVCGRIRHDYPDVPAEAIVFGSAACVSRNLWEISRSYCKSFVMSGDAVPYMSFHNVAAVSADHLPRVISDFIRAAIARDIVQPIYQMPPINMHVNPFELPPPSIESILESLKNGKSVRTTALYPPGELYLFLLEGNVFRTVKIRKIPDCEYFGGFVKGINEKNHSSSIYAECAVHLYEQSKQPQSQGLGAFD